MKKTPRKKTKRTTKLEFLSPDVFQPQPVIGVDEAGRGCLAGSVYAAAVILDPEKDHSLFVDSKTLSESAREEIFELIREEHRVSVAKATVEEIEELNILWASMLAMKRAVLGLGESVASVLVDGNRVIPKLSEGMSAETNLSQHAIVKGDSLYRCIAAGSICAKVSRDREMRALAEEFPMYQFEKHKGYSTPAHKELVATFGPCKHHRRSFAGVKEHLGCQSELS